MEQLDIIIVTNSAGELSAYVRPTVEELSRSFPEARIVLVFTPCQFATGREKEEASKLRGVHEIVMPGEYVAWALMNRPPRGMVFNKKGAVLYMGGDLFHAMLLARKLGFKAVAYSQKNTQWHRAFRSFLVPDENTRDRFVKKGVPAGKIRVIGDLMVDSIPELPDRKVTVKALGLDPARPIISYMPGSRPFQINYMVPFYLECADMIRKTMPEAQQLFIVSPFLVDEDIRTSLGQLGSLYSQEGLKVIQSRGGTRITLAKGENRHEVIAASTLVVTIPGTNTAEIGAIGTPMVVVLPLSRPDPIPFEGSIDYFFRIPLFGVMLKRLVVNLVNSRAKYFALPSIRARKPVVPEIRGKISPKEVAAAILRHAKDSNWLAAVSEDLRGAMGPRGAAKRIAEEIRGSIGE